MAEFTYSGRNKGGQLVSGVLEAVSSDNVASQLMERGVTPIQIEPITRLASSINFKLNFRDWFKPKVKLEELIMLSRQLHSLTKSGVPLNRAMRGLANSSANTTLQQALLEVEKSINTGVTLAASFHKHPHIFNHLYVSVVHVGENSGRLDAAFSQLARYLELEQDTRNRVSGAMRYPSFVLCAIAVAMVVLNLFVIPVFAELFARFDATLPLPTRILIGSSNFFVSYWPFLLAGAVGLFFGVRYYVRTESGLYQWDKLKLRLPIVGDIINRALLARFARTFGLMLSSGVPILQSLELCSQAVDNTYMGSCIRGMRRGIEHGESLYHITAASQLFTPLVLQMIAVGEETGQVDELLIDVAEFYEQQVDYDLKSLSSKIEPILIVGIAGIVAVMALGIFLPMWDMFSVVQG